MQRQVGVARPAADGLVYRGLMLRHLVMPNNVGGSAEVLRWIAANLPKDTYVNIMSQYRPMYRAHEFPAIARRISREEYQEAVDAAREAGLTNLDVQGFRYFLSRAPHLIMNMAGRTREHRTDQVASCATQAACLLLFVYLTLAVSFGWPSPVAGICFSVSIRWSGSPAVSPAARSPLMRCWSWRWSWAPCFSAACSAGGSAPWGR
jgi:hypothetical protein